MKYTSKILSIFAVAALAVACGKEAPNKATVEADFIPASRDLPEATIVGAPVVDASAGTAVFTVNVNGTYLQDEFSVGIILSETESFSSSTFSPLEMGYAGGERQAVATVTPNTTYWAKLGVAAKNGVASSYSEAVKVVVPDVAFWQKVAGSYKGHIVSQAFGDQYDNVITVIPDANDPQNKCIITDIEPYYASKGRTYAATGSNFVEAIIDNDNNTLIVANGTSMNYEPRIVVAIEGPDAIDEQSHFLPQAKSLNFKLSADGKAFECANAFLTVIGDEVEDAYSGGVKYVKQ